MVRSPEAEGPRILMCPPTYFGVRYEINPWMSLDRRADPGRALAQWARLRETLEGLGARVELEEAAPGLPDQVFTANAGFALGGRAVAATFLHPERQGEEPHHERWLAEDGLAVIRCSLPLEGAGDLCGADEVLLGGHGIRSRIEALEEAADWLGVPIVPVRMDDPWLYHLDLIVAPLGGPTALIADRGLAPDARLSVAARFPDLIELTAEETGLFCANCTVVGEHVVMHRCTPRLRSQLAARGLRAVECPVDEFLKAGGGVRCMGLRLDGGPAAPAPAPLSLEESRDAERASRADERAWGARTGAPLA
jgi:N-dimethylarginine dimethylaminohydrolase